MTEEIIIDGVNVAGCGYFCETDKECSICGMGTDGEDTFCRDCKDNSNCYYKQLKRLEEKYNTLVNKFFNSETDKTRLKQENFELKESLKVFNRPDVNRVLTLYKVGDIDLLEKKCDRLEQENKELLEARNHFMGVNLKYFNALEEIRDYLYTLTTVDNDFPNTETYLRINDKIEEVLNEN